MYVSIGARCASGKRAGPTICEIVRAADRIYVLSEGGVVESGSREELIAVGGTYADPFTLQATPYR